MEVFNTESFVFHTFDPSIFEHTEFARSLINDSETKIYLKDLDIFLEEPFTDILNSSYLVGEKEGSLVGYLSMFGYPNFVSLNYAISSPNRSQKNSLGQTKGCSLLKETSEFIFDSHRAIKFIELFINKANIRSIKTAMNAGFINDEGLFYHKYRGIK